MTTAGWIAFGAVVWLLLSVLAAMFWGAVISLGERGQDKSVPFEDLRLIDSEDR